MTGTRRETVRRILRFLLAAIYFVAGVVHLRSPAPFLAITPEWVPYPQTVIAFTGLCEIAGAIGLLTTRFRWWAGVMLAVYAVCVFPANIRHAIDNIAVGGKTLGLWYHVPRLLFQPVIVWWALFAGNVIDWPWRRRRV
ncbi:DoxX family protein [Polymorphobacter sp. PAMC 29334]|uniref:DoxX family protein n=1 Tax=Polymorphobacter sp. PAMC 29334 TaxID=2862331 RepID=UPI001D026759|nr:DoxX family protein [Polymorphobacter sp. PAMC 29334]